MLDDVAHRLTQPQYQTAELLIIAMKRGWRVTERPTLWLPRASGTTKKGKNWLFGLRYASAVTRDLAEDAQGAPPTHGEAHKRPGRRRPRGTCSCIGRSVPPGAGPPAARRDSGLGSGSGLGLGPLRRSGPSARASS